MLCPNHPGPNIAFALKKKTINAASIYVNMFTPSIFSCSANIRYRLIYLQMEKAPRDNSHFSLPSTDLEHHPQYLPKFHLIYHFHFHVLSRGQYRSGYYCSSLFDLSFRNQFLYHFHPPFCRLALSKMMMMMMVLLHDNVYSVFVIYYYAVMVRMQRPDNNTLSRLASKRISSGSVGTARWQMVFCHPSRLSWPPITHHCVDFFTGLLT